MKVFNDELMILRSSLTGPFSKKSLLQVLKKTAENADLNKFPQFTTSVLRKNLKNQFKTITIEIEENKESIDLKNINNISEGSISFSSEEVDSKQKTEVLTKDIRKQNQEEQHGSQQILDELNSKKIQDQTAKSHMQLKDQKKEIQKEEIEIIVSINAICLHKLYITGTEFHLFTYHYKDSKDNIPLSTENKEDSRISAENKEDLKTKGYFKLNENIMFFPVKCYHDYIPKEFHKDDNGFKSTIDAWRQKFQASLNDVKNPTDQDLIAILIKSCPEDRTALNKVIKQENIRVNRIKNQDILPKEKLGNKYIEKTFKGKKRSSKSETNIDKTETNKTETNIDKEAIQILKTELKNKKEIIAGVKQQIILLQAKLNDLNVECEIYDMTNKDKEQTIAKHLKTIDQLKSTQGEKLEEITKLTGVVEQLKIAAVKNRNSRKEAEAELKKTIAKLTEELERKTQAEEEQKTKELKGQIKVLKENGVEKTAEQQQKLYQLEANLNKIIEEKTRLTNIINQLTEQETKLKNRTDKLEKEKEELEEEKEELETELKNKTDDLKNKTEELKNKTDELETANNEIKTEKEKLETANNEIKTEKEKLETANNEIKTLKKNLETANTIKKTEALTLKNKVKELGDEKALVVNLQTEVATLNTQVTSLNTQVTFLRKQVDANTPPKAAPKPPAPKAAPKPPAAKSNKFLWFMAVGLLSAGAAFGLYQYNQINEDQTNEDQTNEDQIKDLKENK